MPSSLSRRAFTALLLSATGAASGLRGTLLPDSARELPPVPFAHPGMLHSHADLLRIRDAVRRKDQPIFAGFELMRDHPQSQPAYLPAGPFPEFGRNPNLHFAEFDRDSNAAYQCALMAFITGDLAFARVSIAILNAWSATLKKISGADAVLAASLGGFKMANAAELICHTNAGWPEPDAQRFGAMLREIFLPVIQNFAAFANGNWDTAAIKLMMAIAIYTDDRPLFDRALVYYRFGCGDGRLEHYLYPTGQCQESGRDQQHTQLGIAHQGDCCEMAWHQGLDLYACQDNRLLLGFEYTARYCLGEDVPFSPDIDQTGKYRHSVISARSALRPVFEQIYNHYVQRKGLDAPWTRKAAEKLRPEGAPFQADATGYGTLLYTRPAGPDIAEAAPFAVPSGLFAGVKDGTITLDFVPLAKPSRYLASRASRTTGPFSPIPVGTGATLLRDRPAKPQQLFSYRIQAAGSPHATAPVTVMDGLPRLWLKQAAATSSSFADAVFTGTTFRITAAEDAFFLHRPLLPDGLFIARLLPLFASQFLTAGIFVGTEADKIRLTISPASGAAEHPVWTLSLHQGEQITAQRPLGTPAVEYGRIMLPVWLRLRQVERNLLAATSLDGRDWSELAQLPLPAGTLRTGILLSSGIPSVSTEVYFDNVTT